MSRPRRHKRIPLMRRHRYYRTFRFLAYAGLVVGLLALGLGFWPFPYGRKAEKMEAGMKVLAAALRAYETDYGEFPDSLDQLTGEAGYLESIPLDPFAEGEQPLHYVKLNRLPNAVIVNTFYASEMQPGSPMHGMTWSRDLYPNYQLEMLPEDPTNGYRDVMHALLSMENDENLEDDVWPKVDALNRFGWSRGPEIIERAAQDPGWTPQATSVSTAVAELQESSADASLSDVSQAIAANETAFDYARAAFRKRNMEMVEVEDTLATHATPNLLALIRTTGLMAATARLEAEEGHWEDAYDSYMGAFYFAMGSTKQLGVLEKLILDRVCDSVHESLQSSLIAEDWPLEYLSSFITDLNAYSREAASRRDGLQDRLDYLRQTREINFNEMLTRGIYDDDFPHRLRARVESLLFYPRDLFVYRKNEKALERAVELADSPFSVQMKNAMDNEIRTDTWPAGRYEFAFDGNFTSNILDSFSADTNYAATLLIAALQHYRATHGHYPDELSELDYLLDPVPLDPYTGEPFRYSTDGETFIHYSLGPDLEDQGGETVYDSDNGWRSKGDIVFGHGRW